MTMILGIDPGSRVTGYGVIRTDGQQHHYITSGTIKMDPKDHESFATRLQTIYGGIHDIIINFRPEEAAIEEVFMHRNPGGALKLGQARGAAMVAAANGALPVAEYSPRQIKQSVVGYGGAQKAQVEHMVKVLLNLSKTLQTDESDALAVALCHSHFRSSLVAKVAGKGLKLGRIQ